VHKNKPQDLVPGVFLLTIEEIRSNKRSIVLVPLEFDFKRVWKCKKLETSLFVEIFELPVTSVVEEVPCS
jgi:hypothetical protein